MMLNEYPRPYLLLTTGEKTEQITGDAGFYEGFLWLALYGKTPQDIYELVFMNGGIQRVEYHYAGMCDVYAGFKDIASIISFTDRTEVRLAGGHIVKEDAPNEGDLADNGSDGISGGEGNESGDIPAEQPAE